MERKKLKNDNVIDMLRHYGFVKGLLSNMTTFYSILDYIETGKNPFHSEKVLKELAENAKTMGSRISSAVIDMEKYQEIYKSVKKIEFEGHDPRWYSEILRKERDLALKIRQTKQAEIFDKMFSLAEKIIASYDYDKELIRCEACDLEIFLDKALKEKTKYGNLYFCDNDCKEHYHEDENL